MKLITPINLYILNTALLFTHEIDSAYWQEWNLFGLPGGIQFFDLLHIPLLIAALVGLQRLVEGAKSGHAFALVLAAAGVAAFALHTFFIAAGHPEFRQPVSLAILAATLCTSLPQGILAWRALRHGK